MRTKGSFEYGKEVEDQLLSEVGVLPGTTHAIAEKFRNIYGGVHDSTVLRLLERLHDRGEIKKKCVGKMRLWCR